MFSTNSFVFVFTLESHKDMNLDPGESFRQLDLTSWIEPIYSAIKGEQTRTQPKLYNQPDVCTEKTAYVISPTQTGVEQEDWAVRMCHLKQNSDLDTAVGDAVGEVGDDTVWGERCNLRVQQPSFPDSVLLLLSTQQFVIFHLRADLKV